jgi:ATP-dependent helicase/DNAse subunit B
MRILYGPPGDSSRTTWFRSFADDPDYASGTLWITPTQRKSQWVGRCFRERNCRFPPRIHTFDDMARLLYERMGGDAGMLPQDAVYAALIAVMHEPEIEKTLQEYLKEMPGPGFVAETARQIDELQRHGMTDDTLASIPDAHEGYGGMFLALYRSYRKFLQQHRKIDAGGIHVRVAEKLQENSSAHPVDLPWNRCIFDGFLELTPLQLDIIRGLEHRLDVTLVWPGNPAPEGLFQWTIAGMKIAFSNAEWHPLIGGNPSMNETGCTAGNTAAIPPLAKAAFHFGGYAPDCLPADLEPHPAPDRLRLMERGTLLDEVTAIARDIRLRMNQGGIRWSDIGVTFPNLQTYMPTIRRIFQRFDIPVNISQALPLTGSPVFTSILRLLKLADDWDRHDLLAVLGDSSLTGMPPEKTHAVVRRVAVWSSEHKIVRGRERWISMLQTIITGSAPTGSDTDIAAGALDVVRRLAQALQKPAGQNGSGTEDRYLAGLATTAEWLAWLRRVLADLQVNRNIEYLQRFALDNMPSGSQNFEYTRRAYNRLLEYFDAVEPFLAGAGTVSEKNAGMTAAAFRETFRRMLAGIDYQLTTRAGDRVQVLGLLGIRGLTFRHVYMGGMTDTAFPRHRPLSPFWQPDLIDTILEAPANIQKTIAFTDMIRVMEAPLETLTLSRPMREGDEELLPSPVLEYVSSLVPDFETAGSDNTPLCLADRSIQAARNLVPDCHVTARALVGKAIAGQKRLGTGRWCGDLEHASEQAQAVIRTQFGPERSFSPTLLETYINCPRAFFFERLLGLGEPDEPAEDVSGLDRGAMIHRVLNRFYRERVDRVSPRVTAAESDICAERIREIAAEEYTRLGYSGEAARREYLDIVGCPELSDDGLALRFVRREVEGSPALQPRLLEWSFGGKKDSDAFVLIDEDGRNIVMTGKIDRLDLLDGRDAVIWDYKTGKQLPRPTDIQCFQRIQVGVYMLAAAHILKHPVNAGGYYHVQGRSDPDLVTVLRREGSEITAYLPEKGRSNTLKREWPETEFLNYMDTLKTVIGRTVSAIRRGRFIAAETSDPCSRCVFGGLCRRARENHDAAV